MQLKKDSDERVNDVDLQNKTEVAERQNASSLGEDENSDDDAEMDVNVKNISAGLHRNVTVADNEEASGSSKSAVQESYLPEVSHC